MKRQAPAPSKHASFPEPSRARAPATGRGNAHRNEQVGLPAAAADRELGPAAAPEERGADTLAARILAELPSVSDKPSRSGVPEGVAAAVKAVTGQDLSRTRIVVGGEADKLTQGGAGGLTLDDVVYLPAGVWGSSARDEVLAHELAHVALGHGASGKPARRFTAGPSTSASTLDEASAGTDVATSASTGPEGPLRSGDSGAGVKTLQDLLVQAGFLSPQHQATGPGIFGPRTKAALIAFQTAHSLAPTGVYDTAERDALSGSSAKSDTTSSGSASTDAAWPNVELARGAQGPDVQALQSALVTAGFLTAAAMATGPGLFGGRTEAAVMAAQSAKGLAPSGRYDAATRAALAGTPTTAAPSSGSDSADVADAGAPEADLRRGDKGDSVAALQDALVQLGYLSAANKASGPGLFGPRTESALQAFQRAHSISPTTGVYDTTTRDWLQRRLAGEAAPEIDHQSQGLPTTEAEADEHFISQFRTNWNPTGPSSSTNCGPASLAMMMSAKGMMPEGLSKEQQVDHARALMYPTDSRIKTVDVNGQDVKLLDQDKELSGTAGAIEAINNLGATGSRESGWEALDARLDAGCPVLAYGYLGSGWKEQFDERVGAGEMAHFNAILGRTAEGLYLVCDPMHTGGANAMDGADLAAFFPGGKPEFVAWVDGPSV